MSVPAIERTDVHYQYSGILITTSTVETPKSMRLMSDVLRAGWRPGPAYAAGAFAIIMIAIELILGPFRFDNPLGNVVLIGMWISFALTYWMNDLGIMSIWYKTGPSSLFIGRPARLFEIMFLIKEAKEDKPPSDSKEMIDEDFGSVNNTRSPRIMGFVIGVVWWMILVLKHPPQYSDPIENFTQTLLTAVIVTGPISSAIFGGITWLIHHYGRQFIQLR